MFDRRRQDLEKSIFSRIYLFANGGTIASLHCEQYISLLFGVTVTQIITHFPF